MHGWMRVGLCMAALAWSASATFASPEPSKHVQQTALLKETVAKTRQSLAALRTKAISVVNNRQVESEEDEYVSTYGNASQDDVLKKLQELDQKMQEMQRVIEDIQGWIEGQQEGLTVMANDVTELKRIRHGNYMQFQYRDTNEPGGAPDAFSLRRFRLSQTNTIDPRTSLRMTFDVATGTDTLQAQLRDAQLIWDIEPSDVRVGVQLLTGQQPLPLGYELERSSGEREFPERTVSNRTMFSGERGRGVYLRYGLGNNALAHVGVWNALTFNDPEQRGRAPGVANKLGVSAGLRLYSTNYDLGVSTFVAKRPAFTANNQTSPQVDRRFVFLDGSYVGLLLPNLFVRGEAMFGKDRVPSTTASPTNTAKDMVGWHALLGYNLSARNQLALRYEQFDPNRDTAGNAIHGYGAAYIYYINPGARVTAAYEVFFDPAKSPKRYHITTLRLQFRM